ncbi:MAG TPA: hypothetical protein DCL21_05755 [Alphaproteobacteria bacterium]|nr:hypothetical protein [Alphaproteobacteria bacterium]
MKKIFKILLVILLIIVVGPFVIGLVVSGVMFKSMEDDVKASTAERTVQVGETKKRIRFNVSEKYRELDSALTQSYLDTGIMPASIDEKGMLLDATFLTNKQEVPMWHGPYLKDYTSVKKGILTDGTRDYILLALDSDKEWEPAKLTQADTCNAETKKCAVYICFNNISEESKEYAENRLERNAEKSATTGKIRYSKGEKAFACKKSLPYKV